MHVIFTRHALQQAALRGISRNDIIATLTGPDSTVPGDGGKFVAQKAHGSLLLRVVHRIESNGDVVVITAYKTSKAAKYQP
ncbi:MAG: DUF4258 domain-containing protein [Candidatus Sigynarchaeota archaeon]